MSTISDAAQRQAAIDPSRSFIVQAPAGSGKTELLTQRLLALLAIVERPEEVLAITFTRKAAAEMRARVLEALYRAAGPRPEKPHEARTWELAGRALARDRQLGWNLVDNPGRLALQTIDSFNASLVRRMPWGTRLGGMPRLIEDPFPLYRRAAEGALSRLRRGGTGGEGGVALLLTHLDNRLDLIRDLLVGMLARRDQWLRHLVGRRAEEQRAALERSLRALIEAQLREALERIPRTIRGDLEALVRFAAANLVSEGKDGPLARLAELPHFPGASAQDLPAWKGLIELLLTSGGDLRKTVDKRCGFPADRTEPCMSMKRRMKEVLEWMTPEVAECLGRVRDLPPVAYEEEQWRVLRELVDLLPLAVAELWLVFQEEGGVDFAEIALKAQQALDEAGNPTDLLMRLDNRISHILVDEFQDTSFLQYALLCRLTDGWTAGDGRSLFLVGDPMQSIYRFREAEVGLFLTARSAGLGTIPLEPVRLCANFRSQRGIVDWVNSAFGILFPPAEDPARGAVPLSEAEAVHALLEGRAVQVHARAERNDAAEAGRVVELVRQAREEDPRGSVAVLVRSRTHLARILPALREAGLRYQAQDIDLLAERPVARDLLSLTRAVLHPEDRLAWLSVLRSPLCGLTLSDLHALCGGVLRPIPALLSDPEVLSRLSEDGRLRAGKAGPLLIEAARRRGRVGLRSLVEGVWLSLGGPVLLDAAALEDAGRVLALLGELDYGGDLRDFEELEAGLRRLFAAPDTGADGSLQVMTIHKAKGLEFDTVILPGLGRKPGKSDPPLLRWLDHPRFGLLLGPIHPRDGASRDPIYEAIGRVEKDKEDLEATRLLYVAATRAKKRLHLLGHAPRNREGECRPEPGSLLRKLWPVVETSFADLPDVEASPEALCAPPVLRRLAASWSPPALSAAPLPTPPKTVNPSDLGKEDSREAVFSGWEAETARHIGTVAHAFLERIGREGPERWTPERVGAMEPSIRRLLGQSGVPAGDLPGAQEKILKVLRQALAGERSGWILKRRPVAECEYELSGVVEGRLVHAVIDRTFLDEHGTRWIIDYKTSEPRRGESTETFLRTEAEKYGGQMATYLELFRLLEPGREVRAGLYFPLVDGWREVTPVAASSKEAGGGQLPLFAT